MESFLVSFLLMIFSACAPTQDPIATRRVPKQPFEEKIYQKITQNDTRGINPDYLLTIAILETGHGTGHLYQNSNNLFSIKADENYSGNEYWEAGELYRNYKTEDESIQDVVRSFTTLKRYRRAYRAAILDERKVFFNSLQNSGYAEDKQYGQKLEKVFQLLKRREVTKRFSQYEIVGCSINHSSTCPTLSN